MDVSIIGLWLTCSRALWINLWSFPSTREARPRRTLSYSSSLLAITPISLTHVNIIRVSRAIGLAYFLDFSRFRSAYTQ